MIGKFLVRFFVFAAACHQASTYYVLPPPRCPLQHFLYAPGGSLCSAQPHATKSKFSITCQTPTWLGCYMLYMGAGWWLMCDAMCGGKGDGFGARLEPWHFQQLPHIAHKCWILGSSALCPKPAAPFHFWLTAAACCKTFACHNLCASHVNPEPESFAKCHNQLVEVLRYFQDPCQPYYASNSRNWCQKICLAGY